MLKLGGTLYVLDIEILPRLIVTSLGPPRGPIRRREHDWLIDDWSFSIENLQSVTWSHKESLYMMETSCESLPKVIPFNVLNRLSGSELIHRLGQWLSDVVFEIRRLQFVDLIHTNYTYDWDKSPGIADKDPVLLRYGQAKRPLIIVLVHLLH